jgi:diguanylate cyclase (GGDEF)-like protein/PAS domain S-box-containing protein
MRHAEDRPLRVLLVEDDEDDYIITRDLLASQDRAAFELEWAPTYEQALEAVAAHSHDVYLVDYRLGGHTGLELVREAFAGEPQAPVILLTGRSDYRVDLEATLLGVTDFLVKGTLEPVGLERSIRYAVRHHVAMRDLRRSEERYELATRAANDGIWDWDLSDGTMYFSPRWKTILGYGEDLRADGLQAWLGLVHPDDVERLQGAIQAHRAGRTPHFENEHRIRHADGTWRWVLSRGVAIRDQAGRATRMAGSLSDITGRRNAEQRLVHDAFHDALTGLPNRALFTDRLAQALRRIERDASRRSAVLFIDLDGFKLVNDSLGHGTGDELLVALARRLGALLRPGDTVARLGGDEFTILLDDLGDQEGAIQAAERVQEAIAEPFRVAERELFVSTSIGICLNSPGMGPAEMLRNADIAMYDAKRHGRSRSAVFDQSMHRRMVSRMSRETVLRQAIETERLRTFFQPIVDLASGRIVALEALARWPADREEVAPDEFIPIAEETGLISALGRLVLRSGCRALADWRDRGVIGPDIQLSVNVSARQLADAALIADVRSALEDSGLPGEALALELTESTLMENPAGARAVLAQLGRLGIGVQLDDFGTGYSSLTLLNHFPGDTLKVDRSFVATLHVRQESQMIVRAIIALAHNLGMRVIAEGIDHAEQLRHLRDLGCTRGQGFLFAVPLPPGETEDLLTRWTPPESLVLAGLL